MNKCIIIVPCYNEERRLDRFKFLDYLARTPHITFLFVNDGSRDGTIDLLNEMHALNPHQVLVLDKKKNGGKGEAVRDGMRQGLANPDFDFVGFWDADLATPLEAIEDLLNVLIQRPDIQMIFGSRVALLGRNIQRQPIRHYLGRVFATFASIVLKLPIYDTQCGAKIFRSSAELRDILSLPFSSRWIFDVEIIARFVQRNRADAIRVRDRIYEFPLHAWYDVPGSKVKPTDFFLAVKELFTIWNRYIR